MQRFILHAGLDGFTGHVASVERVNRRSTKAKSTSVDATKGSSLTSKRFVDATSHDGSVAAAQHGVRSTRDCVLTRLVSARLWEEAGEVGECCHNPPTLAQRQTSIFSRGDAKANSASLDNDFAPSEVP